MVIKEAMRLHSPVPFIQRILTADTEIDGKTAPAGTLVNCVLYNIHHNPAVWPDSLKFDPNRFLPENVEKRHPYSFVPFSAGPRNCIGQNFAMDEIKIILARILHRVNIRLDPDHKVEKLESVVMRAKNDIRLFVSERQ
ncbi:cytochrome P450 [Elysia marginata]|uniref:Cytochrome P450 n=1 Tax=Elysia marginata TaxID=1093978 RepID=A0AAV4FHG6_9GAST|nr:cytochrome P450 [Elysia marginata]